MRSNITLYSNQKVAFLNEAPMKCIVSSVKPPNEGVQTSLEAIFEEDLKKMKSE